jgi:hypothetical protein
LNPEMGMRCEMFVQVMPQSWAAPGNRMASRLLKTEALRLHYFHKIVLAGELLTG